MASKVERLYALLRLKNAKIGVLQAKINVLNDEIAELRAQLGGMKPGAGQEVVINVDWTCSLNQATTSASHGRKESE